MARRHSLDRALVFAAVRLGRYSGAGAFNGFNLEFAGAPTIVNVTLDAASTILPVPFMGPPTSSASGISFNAPLVNPNRRRQRCQDWMHEPDDSWGGFEGQV